MSLFRGGIVSSAAADAATPSPSAFVGFRDVLIDRQDRLADTRASRGSDGAPGHVPRSQFNPPTPGTDGRDGQSGRNGSSAGSPSQARSTQDLLGTAGTAGGRGTDGGRGADAVRGQDGADATSAGDMDLALRLSGPPSSFSTGASADVALAVSGSHSWSGMLRGRGVLLLVARGGDGGGGGDGVSGGQGGTGGAGGDGGRGGDYGADGGNGGDGGRGGDSGSACSGCDGGRAGDGGDVRITLADPADTPLLMAVEVVNCAGDPGRAGSMGTSAPGGRGGRGGRGGAGGSSCSAIVRDGVTVVGSVSSGSRGRDGHEGQSGREGASASAGRRGAPGRDGALQIVVGGATYSGRYELVLSAVNIVPIEGTSSAAGSAQGDLGTGVFEPGCLVAITDATVRNVGAMPSPAAQFNLGNIRGFSSGVEGLGPTTLTVPPLAAGAQITVPGTLFMRLSPAPPPVPVASGPGSSEAGGGFSSTALLAAEISLLGRFFAKGGFVVSLPVRHAVAFGADGIRGSADAHAVGGTVPGGAGTSLVGGAGDVLTCTAEITNRSLKPSPVGRDGVRVVVASADPRMVKVAMLAAEAAEPAPQEFAATASLDLASMPAGGVSTCRFAVSIAAGSKPMQAAQVRVELWYRGQCIEVRTRRVKCAPRFSPPSADSPAADVLLVTGPQFNGRELRAWEGLLAALGLTVNVWDVEGNGGFSLDTATGQRHRLHFRDHYRSSLILFPASNARLAGMLSGDDIMGYLTASHDAHRSTVPSAGSAGSAAAAAGTGAAAGSDSSSLASRISSKRVRRQSAFVAPEVKYGHSGYVFKKPVHSPKWRVGILDQWKRRYLVLTGSALCYYEDEASARSRTEQKGMVLVGKTTTDAPELRGQPDFGFVVESPSGERMVLRVESADERRLWLDAIDLAVQQSFGSRVQALPQNLAQPSAMEAAVLLIGASPLLLAGSLVDSRAMASGSGSSVVTLSGSDFSGLHGPVAVDVANAEQEGGGVMAALRSIRGVRADLISDHAVISRAQELLNERMALDRKEHADPHRWAMTQLMRNVQSAGPLRFSYGTLQLARMPVPRMAPLVNMPAWVVYRRDHELFRRPFQRREQLEDLLQLSSAKMREQGKTPVSTARFGFVSSTQASIAALRDPPTVRLELPAASAFQFVADSIAADRSPMGLVLVGSQGGSCSDPLIARCVGWRVLSVNEQSVTLLSHRDALAVVQRVAGTPGAALVLTPRRIANELALIQREAVSWRVSGKVSASCDTEELQTTRARKTARRGIVQLAGNSGSSSADLASSVDPWAVCFCTLHARRPLAPVAAVSGRPVAYFEANVELLLPPVAEDGAEESKQSSSSNNGDSGALGGTGSIETGEAGATNAARRDYFQRTRVAIGVERADRGACPAAIWQGLPFADNDAMDPRAPAAKYHAVGWSSEGSYGLHTRFGKKVVAIGGTNTSHSYVSDIWVKPSPVVPRVETQRFVLGCGVDFALRAVFFTMNGTLLGTAFTLPEDLVQSGVPLFPSISVSGRASVTFNFGNRGPTSFLASLPALFSQSQMLAEHAVFDPRDLKRLANKFFPAQAPAPPHPVIPAPVTWATDVMDMPHSNAFQPRGALLAGLWRYAASEREQLELTEYDPEHRSRFGHLPTVPELEMLMRTAAPAGLDENFGDAMLSSEPCFAAWAAGVGMSAAQIAAGEDDALAEDDEDAADSAATPGKGFDGRTLSPAARAAARAAARGLAPVIPLPSRVGQVLIGVLMVTPFPRRLRLLAEAVLDARCLPVASWQFDLCPPVRGKAKEEDAAAASAAATTAGAAGAESGSNLANFTSTFAAPPTGDENGPSRDDESAAAAAAAAAGPGSSTLRVSFVTLLITLLYNDLKSEVSAAVDGLPRLCMLVDFASGETAVQESRKLREILWGLVLRLKSSTMGAKFRPGTRESQIRDQQLNHHRRLKRAFFGGDYQAVVATPEYKMLRKGAERVAHGEESKLKLRWMLGSVQQPAFDMSTEERAMGIVLERILRRRTARGVITAGPSSDK